MGWSKQLSQTKLLIESTRPLKQGEILVAIDKFRSAAKTLAMRFSGDMIGYWKF